MSAASELAQRALREKEVRQRQGMLVLHQKNQLESECKGE